MLLICDPSLNLIAPFAPTNEHKSGAITYIRLARAETAASAEKGPCSRTRNVRGLAEADHAESNPSATVHGTLNDVPGISIFCLLRQTKVNLDGNE